MRGRALVGGAALLVASVLPLVLGTGLVLMGASGLEADWLEVGTLLGLDSREPHVRPTWAGTAALVVALASVVAGIRVFPRWDETRRRRRR